MTMKQEDKELLLLDLCTRLPYGVKVNEGTQGDFTLIGLAKERVFTTCEVESCHNDFPIELIKPYLFPLSSMTEEQIHEFNQILGKDCDVSDGYINIIDSYRKTFSYQELDALLQFLNKHHFDYRGLIEKGLAIEAPEGMYN